MKYWITVITLTVALAAPGSSAAQDASTAVVVEKGEFTLHLLLHPIGKETYQITRASQNGGLVMNSQLEYSDRGRKRTVSAVLRMKDDFSPAGFEVKSASGNATPSVTPEDAVEVHDGASTVREGQASREITLPAKFFVGFGYTPASVQM